MNQSLTQIRGNAQQIWKQLKWEIQVVNTDSTLRSIIGCASIREAVEFAESLSIFKSQTEVLKSTSLYSTSDDKIRIPAIEANKIDATAKALDDLLEGFEEALQKVLPEEPSSSLNIKLPPINDFDDLAKSSRDIHLAFTQVLYLDEVNGNMKIESVENGSIWLNVVLEGAVSMLVIGAVIWSGAVIYKKILEGRMMEQQLRALTIRTESMENVLEAQKESLTQLIQVEADHINSTTFKNNIPENTERIKNSIELFAGLLDKGAEIHPSIGAPEEVSNLYPNMKALPTIESKIKQLPQ